MSFQDDPGQIRIQYPEDNTVVPLGPVQFVWGTDSLSYSNRIEIKDSEGIALVDSLVQDTSIIIDQLFVSGEWYSWRVKGVGDERIEGVWSDTKSFKYPIIPVQKVLQSEPLDNSIDLPISRALQWLPDPNADRYIVQISVETLPDALTVSGVYPNPARHHASFDLVVPQAQPVSISVYDALGKRRSYEEIAQHAEGKRKIDLDLQGLPSGVYILSVQADRQQ